MKKTQNYLILLNIIFVVSIVVANVVGCKIINTGMYVGGIELAMSGGAITYAFTFLCTDVIGELWGKKEANAAVMRGFVAQLFALFLIIATQHTPTNNETMQQAYETLLGQTPYFVAGSLCAYLASQTWDVFIFHKVRDFLNGKSSMRWIWNNVSTITSQIFDTALYCAISFGLGLGIFWQHDGWSVLAGLFIGQYLLKVCLALLDTPFFYLLTQNKE